MIQSWIAFELTIRIHYAGYETNPALPRVPLAPQKCLNAGQRAVTVLTAFAFTVYCIADIITAQIDGNEGGAFLQHHVLVSDILGYCYIA